MKALLNSAKRALAIVFAVAFVFTTFFFTDLGLDLGLLFDAQATITSTALEQLGRPTDITFLVPETIYLEYNSTRFKYYIDSSSGTGTLTQSSIDTAGNIYFIMGGNTAATSATLSATWLDTGSAVTFTAGSKSWTNTGNVSTSVTAGTSSSSAGGKVIKWQMSYTYAGKTYTANAYSYVYAPNALAIGAGANCRLKSGGVSHRMYGASMGVLCGFHKRSTNSSYPAYYPTSKAKGSSRHSNLDLFTGSAGTYNAAFITNGIMTAENMDIYSWSKASTNGLLEGGSTSSGGVSFTPFPDNNTSTATFYYVGNDNDSDQVNLSLPTSYTIYGEITVDTSRTTNLNQVPYLTAVSFFTYQEWAHDDDAGLRIYMQSTLGTDGTQIFNKYYGNDSSDEFNHYGSASLDFAVSGTGTSVCYTHVRNSGHYDGTWDNMDYNHDFYTGLVINKVTKASLRAKIKEAIAYGADSNIASAANVATFQTALANASTILGNPDVTQSQIDAQVTALNSALSTIKSQSTETKASYSAPSLLVYVPECVYLEKGGTAFQWYVNDASAFTATSITQTTTGYVKAVNGNTAYTITDVQIAPRIGTGATSITYNGAAITSASQYKSMTLGTTYNITGGVGINTASTSASGSNYLVWDIRYKVAGNPDWQTTYRVTVIHSPHQGTGSWQQGNNYKRESCSHSTVDFTVQRAVMTGAPVRAAGTETSGTAILYVNKHWQTAGQMATFGDVPNMYIRMWLTSSSHMDSSTDQQIQINGTLIYRSTNNNPGNVNYYEYYNGTTTVNAHSGEQNGGPRGVAIPTTTTAGLQIYFSNSSKSSAGTASGSATFTFNSVTIVDKDSAVAALDAEFAKCRQAEWYTSATWTNYINGLAELAFYCYRPDVAFNDTPRANLVNAAAALVQNTVTGTANHKSTRTGSSLTNNIIQSETKSLKTGDTAYLYYNRFEGYTLATANPPYSAYTRPSTWSRAYNLSGVTHTTSASGNPTNPSLNTALDTLTFLKTAPTWTIYYNPIFYTVNYDPNGGKFSDNVTTTKSGGVYYDDNFVVGKYLTSNSINASAYTSLGVPTRVGYDFSGWLCSKNNEVYSDGYTFPWKWTDSGVTFTAQWTAKSYDVSYDLRGGTLRGQIIDADGNTVTIEKTGTAMNSGTYDRSYIVTPLEDTIPGTMSMTKAGYTWSGAWKWSYDNQTYEDGAVINPFQVTEATTFITHWIPNTYELAYDNIFVFESWANSDSYGISGGASITKNITDGSVTITNPNTTEVYTSWSGSVNSNYYSMPITGGAEYKITYNLSDTSVATEVYLFYFDANNTRLENKSLPASGTTFTAPASAAYAQLRFDVNVQGTQTFSNIKIAKVDPYFTITYPNSAVRQTYAYSDDEENYGSTTYGTLMTPNAWTGHDFEGWYLTEDNSYDPDVAESGTQITASSAKTAYSRTVYSHWSYTTYTISFVTAGSEVSDLNYNIASTSVTLPTTDRTGYTFDNWEITTAAGNWTANSTYPAGALALSSNHGNITMTAQWTPITYTISFETDGGSAVSNVNYNIETTTLTLPTTTKSGYSFAGWKVTTEGGNWTADTTLNADANTVSGKYGNITMTAQWTRNKTVITLNPNGGTWSDNTTANKSWNVNSNTTVSLPTNEVTGDYNLTLTKKGYTYNGWSKTSGTGTLTNNGADAASTFETAASETTATLTAQWAAINYTITFDGNGGTPSKNTQAYTITSTSVSLATATRPGYTFSKWVITDITGHASEQWATETGGWALSTEYSSGQVVALTAGSYWGNVTMTAQWDTVSYTVTLNAGGGFWNGNDSDKTNKTFSYDINSTELGTIPAIERYGYTFTNWRVTLVSGNWSGIYTNNNLANLSSMYGNPTLTAQWAPKQYTINYYNQLGATSAAYSDTDIDMGDEDYAVLDPEEIGISKTGYTFSDWISANDITYATGDSITWESEVLNNTQTAVNLYALWTPTNYTITFATAGTAANSITYTIEDTSVTLPTTARAGYTFVNWEITTADGNWIEGEVYNKGANAVSGKYGDITMTAQWNPINYTVTWDANGGNITTTGTTAYTIGTGTIALPEAEKAGYVVKNWEVSAVSAHASEEAANKTGGWSVGTTYTSDIERTAEFYGNVTLKANWTQISYTITWDRNGGAIGNAGTTSYTIGTQTIALATVTRAGYTFKEWKVSEVTAHASETKLPSTGGWTVGTVYTANFALTEEYYGNVTLKAEWTPITYTITYNGNEGTPSVESQTYKISDNAISLATATRTGYTFGGWSATSISAHDDEQYSIKNGGWNTTSTYNTTITTNNTYYGNVTLTAKWTATKYTITYNLDGGSIGGDTANVTTDYYISTAKVTTPAAPEMRGYAFTSWKVTSAAGTWVLDTEYAASFDISLNNAWGNITMTAQYTPVEFILTLDANGGTWTYDGGNAALVYLKGIATVDTVTLPSNSDTAFAVGVSTSYTDTVDAKISRTGYTLIGWVLASGAGELNGYDYSYGIGDATVKAQWQETQYTITYNADGGNWNGNIEDKTVGYTVNSATTVTYAAPEKTGYTFLNWSVTDAGEFGWTEGNTYNAATEIALNKWYGDVTLTAQWQLVNYTVTFEEGYAEGGSSVKTYTVEDTEFELESEPERIGYEFLGWQLTAAAEGWFGIEADDTVYAANDILTFDSYYGDGAVFTAQWSGREYQYSYDINGGLDLDGGTFLYFTDYEGSYTLEGGSWTEWDSEVKSVVYDSEGNNDTVVLPGQNEVVYFYDEANQLWYYLIGWAGYPEATYPDYMVGEEIDWSDAFGDSEMMFYAVWSANYFQLIEKYEWLKTESTDNGVEWAVLPASVTNDELYAPGGIYAINYDKDGTEGDGKYTWGYNDADDPISNTSEYSAFDETVNYVSETFYYIMDALLYTGYIDSSAYDPDNIMTGDRIGEIVDDGGLISNLDYALDGLVLKSATDMNDVACESWDGSYYFEGNDLYSEGYYPILEECDCEEGGHDCCHSFYSIVEFCNNEIFSKYFMYPGTDDYGNPVYDFTRPVDASQCFYTALKEDKRSQDKTYDKYSVEELYKLIYGTNGLYNYGGSSVYAEATTEVAWKAPAQSWIDSATQSIAAMYHNLEIKSADYSILDAFDDTLQENPGNEYHFGTWYVTNVRPDLADTVIAQLDWTGALENYFCINNTDDDSYGIDPMKKYYFGTDAAHDGSEPINRELLIFDQALVDSYVENVKDYITNLQLLSASYEVIYKLISYLPYEGTSPYPDGEISDKMNVWYRDYGSDDNSWVEFDENGAYSDGAYWYYDPDKIDFDYIALRYTEESINEMLKQFDAVMTGNWDYAAAQQGLISDRVQNFIGSENPVDVNANNPYETYTLAYGVWNAIHELTLKEFTLTFQYIDLDNTIDNDKTQTLPNSTYTTVLNYGTYIDLSDKIVAPERHGDTFIGWYTDRADYGYNPSGTPLDLSSSYVVTGDSTWYTGWSQGEPIVYYVEKNDNAITNVYYTDNPTYGETYNVVASDEDFDMKPEKAGYEFSGWSFTYGNETTVYNYGDAITNPNPWATTTPQYLVAVFTPVEYNITYLDEDGTEMAEYADTYTIETASVTLPSPTRTGYSFNKWVVESKSDVTNGWADVGILFNGGAVISTAGNYGDITFKASWNKDGYLITLNENGGTEAEDIGYDITTESVTLPYITRNGYTFDGWKVTSASENGWVADTVYADGTNDIIVETDGWYGDATLDAQWILNTYTITFVTDGGTAVENITYTVEDTSIILPATSKDGYTFTGWKVTGNAGSNWTIQTYTNVAPNATAISAKYGDITMTAQWRANETVLTVNPNGGKWSDDTTVAREILLDPNGTTTYTVATATTADSTGYTISRVGYELIGWTLETSGNGTYADGVYTVNPNGGGSDTLKAQWKAVNHKVTFNAAGGKYIGDTETETGVEITTSSYATVPYGAEISSGTSAMNTENYWPVPTDYTVELDVDGNTDETVTIVFEGWFYGSYNAENDAYVYGSAANATDLMETSDIELYAKWSINTDTFVRVMKDCEEVNLNWYTRNTLNELNLIYRKYVDLYTEITSENITKHSDIDEITTAIIEVADKFNELCLNNENTDASDHADGKADDAAAGAPVINIFENNTVQRNELTSASANGEKYNTTLTTNNGETVALSDVITNASGGVNYIYNGKNYYTNYCYTSDEHPVILISAEDIAIGNGNDRVSYPLTASVTSTNGARSVANYASGKQTVKNTTYDEYKISDGNGGYTGIGSKYNETGYDYYTGTDYIVLTPDFSYGQTDYAVYTLYVYDDSAAVDENAAWNEQDYNLANYSHLEGAGDYAGKSISIGTITLGNANTSYMTPAYSVSFYIYYKNSMHSTDTNNDGVYDNTYDAGRQTGGEGNSNYYFEGYSTWTSVEDWVTATGNRIHRNSAGAANDDLGKNATAEKKYTIDDPVYGQTGLGCFFYYIDPVENEDIVNAYFNSVPLDKSNDTSFLASYSANEQDLANALDIMHDAVLGEGNYDGKAVTTENWTATSSFKNISENITTEKGLVYVHLVDRWGNCFDNILRLNNFDMDKPTAAAGSNGVDLVVTETGGSGIKDISLYEYAYEAGPEYLENQNKYDVVFSTTTNKDYFSFDGNNYSFQIPEEYRVANGRYTALITDVAGNKITTTIVLSDTTDYNCVIAIVDEMMTSSLTIDANGGTFANGASLGAQSVDNSKVDSVVVSEDTVEIKNIPYTQIDLSEYVPEKEGYEFAGWTLKHENNEGRYGNGTVTEGMTSAGTFVLGDNTATGDTLTAIWKKSAALSAQSVELNVVTEETEAKINEVDVDGDYYYEFTMNGEYTVRLFDDVAPYECEVSVNTTVGGSMKFYVDGKRVYPTNGKIVLMSNTSLTFKAIPKAGYELAQVTVTNGTDTESGDLNGNYMIKIYENISITAVFESTEVLNKVTVINGGINGKKSIDVSPYSNVTIAAYEAPEGKVFSHWALNDENGDIVSYDEIYTFVVMSDITLAAVYADVVVEEASIIMDAAAANSVTIVNGLYRLAYTGKITMPADCTLKEFGIVLSNQAEDAYTADNFVIGSSINGVKTAKLAADSISKDGQFKININNVAQGAVRGGRLYMVYVDAAGEEITVYSSTWVVLKAEISGESIGADSVIDAQEYAVIVVDGEQASETELDFGEKAETVTEEVTAAEEIIAEAVSEELVEETQVTEEVSE